ncbi:uncharacterized protein LOC127281531 [Leptopilina boulardi]|uniref:uncharacterized protein LOC127281531 n=1 Tax=Leptopilina boulardi TaxID=63433 RepID=UPI0021F5C717|nr:uncharacterized protein LOC127281531 [Leptopilina boulardi]
MAELNRLKIKRIFFRYFVNSTIAETISLPVENEAKYLNLTYATQRINLNRREQLHLNLADIFQNHWPHLKQEKHFLAHAETLLGKTVQNIWLENAKNKIPAIYEYFRDYYTKYKKETIKPIIAKNLESVLSEIKNASSTLDSSFPKTIGFLPLLASFFNEEPIFKLADIDASDEEIIKMANITRPILIIKGRSLFDESSQCLIVVEDTILIRTSNVLQGIFLLVLSYYVYGFNYEAKKASSFEFIQRLLLDINPSSKGSRRQRKNKSQKLNEEDSRTAKLINNAIKHINQCI